MKVNFGQFGECNAHFLRYENGRTAIRLMGADSIPVATATVNVPNEHLQKDEVIIKDYSENEGMFRCLLQAGLIRDTGRRVPLGFVEGKVAQLTEEALQCVQQAKTS